MAECLAMSELDLAFFTDEMCEIDDAQGAGDGGGTMPFRLWPAQIGVLWDFFTQRLILILKARQLGISWLSCAFALWLCLFHPGKLVLLFSKGQGDANELLRRVKVLYERLPEWFRDSLPQVVVNNTTKFGFDNESTIESLPATQSAGRGRTASLVILDEAGFLQWATTLYTALKPVIDGGGQFIILSTANGIGNLFHRLWSKAKKGQNAFHCIFLPWFARPGRTLEWFLAMVAEADDPALVPQEYPATATEAFVSSGRSRFLGAWLRRIAERIDRFNRQPLEQSKLPSNLRDVPGLTVFELFKFGCRYVIGADVASGKEGGDYSAAVVLEVVPPSLWAKLFGRRKPRLRQIASMHGHWEPDTFGRYLVELARAYDAELAIERNNQGLTTLTAARDTGYRKIVCDSRGEMGWLTDKLTKPQIVNMGAQILRDDKLELWTGAIVDELQVFSLLKDGSTGALKGYNDDYVIALLIAIHIALMPPVEESIDDEEFEAEEISVF
jgi:hypothetical protein